MRVFGDTSPASLPAPRSVAEIAAIAIAMDREVERRYSVFAGALRPFGSPAIVALLEDLGSEHRVRAGRIEADVTSGELPNIAPEALARFLPQILSESDASACAPFGLTRYRVLAFAVSLAQQTFMLYSYLATAADSQVRAYAERLAHEELSRAARLRVERRHAYHSGRRQPKDDAYPAAQLVDSQADLLAAALAIEGRLARMLEKNRETKTGLSSPYEATCQRLEELRRSAERAGEPSGPMAEQLAKFSESAQANAQTGRDRAMARRHLLVDCERAFTFYDAVTSAPVNEAVMLLAQDLSQAAVARIRQVRAFTDATDEAGRVDDSP